MKKPPQDAPRPLTARALTSCMDVLRPVLTDATVLDLFAGHGRFSEAALKEGAAHATLVEANKGTVNALTQTFAKLSADIITKDVFAFLKENKQTFDIVFADPPFHFWTPEFESQLLGALTSAVSNTSILLVKHPKRVIASVSVRDFNLYKTSVFGDSKLLYYRYGTE